MHIIPPSVKSVISYYYQHCTCIMYFAHYIFWLTATHVHTVYISWHIHIYPLQFIHFITPIGTKLKRYHFIVSVLVLVLQSILLLLYKRDSKIFDFLSSGLCAGGERRPAASSLPHEEGSRRLRLQPTQRQVQTGPVHQSCGPRLSSTESRPQTAGQDHPGIQYSSTHSHFIQTVPDQWEFCLILCVWFVLFACLSAVILLHQWANGKFKSQEVLGYQMEIVCSCNVLMLMCVQVHLYAPPCVCVV